MAIVARGSREAVVRAVEVLAGPPPKPTAVSTSREGRFPTVALAVRGALWGLALGALAPATSGLVMLSGLAAEDVTLVDSTDMGFFFGFVPLMTALVTVLLSLNHWPLRDLAAYHREMSVALLVVGAVMLVELREHGAQVTGDEWVDAWLFVNGSLVLHVLLAWSWIRFATRNITGFHAGRTSWPDDAGAWPARPSREALPWDPPRYTSTAALALRSVVWGVAIGTAAGAAAGTVVVPVLGTLVGAYFGAVYCLPPTALGTAAVVTAVSWRRDTDPEAVYRTVRITLGIVGAVVLVGLWPFLQSARFTPERWEDANTVRVWLIVVPVVVLLLRQCAPRLAATYVDLTRRA